MALAICQDMMAERLNQALGSYKGKSKRVVLADMEGWNKKPMDGFEKGLPESLK